MGFHAFHVDALVGAAGHAHEHVRVALLSRALAAVAFGVGHAGGDQDVLALRFTEKIQETMVILGAVFFVDFVGDRMQDTDGVQARAALKTGAGNLAHAALHLVLFHQVRR